MKYSQLLGRVVLALLVVTPLVAVNEATQLQGGMRKTHTAIQKFESVGDYDTALKLARDGFQEAFQLGLTDDAENFRKSVKCLEEKLLNLGFSRLLFDERGQPRASLLQLLEIVGMPPLNDSEKPLLQINTWAQKHLLRQGERWEEQTSRFEEVRAQLKPLLRELGFINESAPHFREYQGALVHGGLLSRVRLRLHYLVEQWKCGVRFSHLYFLSGERPLEMQYESPDACLEDEHSPLKMRKDRPMTAEFPRTESEMMQFVWEESEIPEDMRKSVKVSFVNAPMKQVPGSERLLRPTTDDTVEYWLKAHPPCGCYLAVTNAPYLNRQDLVVRMIAPKEYSFDTVGDAASEDERMSIFLDELARSIFQTKQAFKK